MLYASIMTEGEALRKVFLALKGKRTQQAIAERAGLREPKVSLYANGRQYPRADNRRKLAVGLGCESLEQLDRGVRLVALQPELADDPEKLKALIGLFDDSDDPERAAAAALENIEDPKIAGILREISRMNEVVKNTRDAMSRLGDDMTSLRRKLIFYVSKASSPEA